MTVNYKKILPHVLIIIGFLLASVAYFSPVLQNKVLSQGDSRQSRAMSSQSREFNNTHDETTYWMENAFGGMPTYLNAPQYPNLYIKEVENNVLQTFLPHPADYIFVYFVGFYILLLVMKIDYKLAALGAIAFGFSTYLMIIIGVGHISKVLAISYMPMVLAGILLSFRKRYIWGGFLLAISLGLELSARHFQITYYALIIAVIVGLVYLYKAYKTKTFPAFFKAIGVMVFAALLAIGANITNVLATKQYTEFSTRDNTGLTISPDGTQKESSGGMSYAYITEYSYGIVESMNLFIPRFIGGATTESLSQDSHTYEYLLNLGVPALRAQQFIEHAPTYWGDQPIVASPNYLGAVVVFLFIFALYLVRGKLKWWVVASCVLALLLSWGKNFDFLTRFFVNYVPLYNKFRTVSMIQVIIQMLVPFLGIIGLSKLFSEKVTREKKLHALKWATIITGGICVFFLLFKTVLFDFSGRLDARYIQNLGTGFVEALKADRVSMLTADTFRTLIFVLLSAALIWAYLKGKLNKNWCILAFGVLVLVDLVGVDKNYVNDSDFSVRSKATLSFPPNAADRQIMKDTGHYRVLDLTTNPLNSARASNFHNSLGGYSGAKPGRYEELFSFYIAKGNQQVINMLNTKYYIIDKDGKPVAQRNPGAFGNVWFVDDVKLVNSVNAEMLSLDKVNLKTTAVVNNKFKELIPKTHYEDAAQDTIYLAKFQPNKLVYKYNLKKPRLAVFSENYYPYGWKIHVDGKPLDMARVNYVLRGVYLPAGQHTVTFEFDPEIIHTGSTITVISGVVMGLLLLLALFYTFKKKQTKSQREEEV